MTTNSTTHLQPTLAQITIFPVKSLDGTIVDRVQISSGGALAFDRRWAIVDERGKVVNAKRTAKIQTLRSRFDLERGLISLRTNVDFPEYTFSLIEDSIDLTSWLSQFFEFPVSIIENAVNGFPDDLDAYGPTIISTATLAAICDWFPDLDLTEVRRRFRTNLELSGVPAFWEDRLFTAPGTAVDFQLGAVRFQGINPCQRCSVITRDSRSGIATPNFQKIFTQLRQHDLPDWVNAERFNHFYRLAVNTQIPLLEAGKFLDVGDGFEALGG
jgi:uncharacterized protein